MAPLKCATNSPCQAKLGIYSGHSSKSLILGRPCWWFMPAGELSRQRFPLNSRSTADHLMSGCSSAVCPTRRQSKVLTKRLAWVVVSIRKSWSIYRVEQAIFEIVIRPEESCNNTQKRYSNRTISFDSLALNFIVVLASSGKKSSRLAAENGNFYSSFRRLDDYCRVTSGLLE